MLTRPDEFDVIATPNLNGDYLSDALAAQVGGIGIAPGGNINYLTGHAIFEATHGTAPKYANQDKVNPGSVVLSGEMMFRYIGWGEAADLIIKGMEGAIGAKTVTYDFARLMEGAKEVKCSRVRRRNNSAHVNATGDLEDQESAFLKKNLHLLTNLLILLFRFIVTIAGRKSVPGDLSRRPRPEPAGTAV